MSFGIGAFIVTFVGLDYLLGPSVNQREFLVIAAISLATAAVATLWLGRDPRKVDSNVDPADFDERATRRAVRRGVVRTALTAVVWLCLAALVAGFGSSLLQQLGGRESHVRLVLDHAVPAALPGWQLTSASCCNEGIRSLEGVFSGSAVSADPVDAAPLDLHVQVGWFGRLTNENELERLPKTGVDVALETVPLSGATARRKLAAIPPDVVATAIVDLRAALAPGPFFRFLAAHDVTYPDSATTTVFLQSSRRVIYHQGGPTGVSWPTPALAGFQDWTKRLHAGDTTLLHSLGLPDVATLRLLAATPRIYGFVLTRASGNELVRFLADRRVADVRVGDLAYDLTSTG